MSALSRAAQIGSALVRTSLLTAMQYRSDLAFDAFAGLLRTVATSAPLWLVFQRGDSIAGWTLPEAAWVMALYLLMQGILGGLVEPNLGEVVESVRSGNFDLVLMKPADAQLLVSVRTVSPSHLWDVLAALALAGWSVSQTGLPAPGDAVVAAGLLICGIASMYALWLMAISLSFWFVRVDNLRFLLWSAADAGRWPIQVFSGWARYVLTFVIPVALLTSFPAMALRGEWDSGVLATSAAVALGFVVLSRLAWTRALASYTSASS